MAIVGIREKVWMDPCESITAARGGVRGIKKKITGVGQLCHLQLGEDRTVGDIMAN